MQWWCSALGVQWTWTWRAYPGVWLFVIAIAVALGWMSGPGAWKRATAAERIAFVAGALLLWASLDWPLGPIAAGYLVSAHAFQFLVETMVAAPLLLVATRTAYGRRMASADRAASSVASSAASSVASGAASGASPGLARFARFAVHPLVAAILFNVVVAATHVPSVVDGLMPSPGGAFIIDAAWFFSGVVFWWPVIMPVPAYDHFGPPLKILYLLVGTLFHTVIGMVLLSSEFPIYGIYELAPPILAIAPKADQQLGGGIMELGVFGAIVVGSGILFFRWAAQSERRR